MRRPGQRRPRRLPPGPRPRRRRGRLRPAFSRKIGQRNPSPRPLTAVTGVLGGAAMQSNKTIPDFLMVFVAGMAWVGAWGATPQVQGGAAPSVSQRAPAGVEYLVPKGTFLRMTMGGPLKMSRLGSGNELDGELARPLYVVDREVLPAGSHIHLVVETVEKERVQEKKGLAERLDSARKLGLGRKYDYHVTFRSASLTLPSGSTLPLRVTFIQGGKLVRLEDKRQEAQGGGAAGAGLGKSASG